MDRSDDNFPAPVGLREGDRNRGLDVITLPLEEEMFPHTDPHKQITGRPPDSRDGWRHAASRALAQIALEFNLEDAPSHLPPDIRSERLLGLILLMTTAMAERARLSSRSRAPDPMSTIPATSAGWSSAYWRAIAPPSE